MAKISKQAAGYVHFDGVDYHCEECYKFEPNGGSQDCAEVGGAIAAIGGCNTFVAGQANQIIPIRIPRKLSHGEAGYAINKPGFGCKRCEYFNAEMWDCRKVDKDSVGADPGMIHPAGCCNHWEKHPVFGAI